MTTKRIKDIQATATESDLTSGNYFAVDTPNITKKLPADLLPAASSLAPVFSASTAYSAGTCVMNLGKLYKFTADHPAGAWSNSDAILIQLPQEFYTAEVTQRLIGNRLDDSRFSKPGCFVGGNGGTIAEFADFGDSGKCPCIPGETLFFYTDSFPSTPNQFNRPIVWYDEDCNYISQSYSSANPCQHIVPDGAFYFSVPIYYPSGNREKVVVAGFLPNHFIPYSSSSEKIKSTVDSTYVTENIFDKTRVTTGKYIATVQNGVEVWIDSDVFGESDFIDVRKRSLFCWYDWVDEPTCWMNSAIIMYDENKQPLLMYGIGDGKPELMLHIPANAAYVRIPVEMEHLDETAFGYEKFSRYVPFGYKAKTILDFALKGDFGYDEKSIISQKFFTQQFGEGNLLNPGAIAYGKLINGNGEWVNYAGYGESDFIPCKSGDFIYRYRESDSESTWETRLSIAFFDSDKQFVASVETNGQTMLPIPNNSSIRYFRYPVNLSFGEIRECVSRYIKGVFIPYKTKSLDGSQWMGKRWYAYGTSITDTTPTGKYLPYLAKMSGLVAVDKGFGGGGIGNLGGYSTGQVFDAICNITDGKTDADIITLETGANDTAPGVPLGTIYDTTQSTLAGCLNICLRYLQENTNAQIAVMPSVAHIQAEPNENDEYYEWAWMIRKICEINRVFFINPACNLGYGKLNGPDGTLYRVDSIHQTDLGGYILAEAMWEQIKRIPNFRTALPT